MQYEVTVFYNTRREALDQGYETGDVVEQVAGPLTVEGESIREAASATFRLFNIEDGAVVRGIRSLSVGDVIYVEHSGGVWLTVEGQGFGMIDPPSAQALTHA